MTTTEQSKAAEQIDALAERTRVHVHSLVMGFVAGAAGRPNEEAGDAIAAVWSGLIAATAEFSRVVADRRDVDEIADVIREGAVEWLLRREAEGR